MEARSSTYFRFGLVAGAGIGVWGFFPVCLFVQIRLVQFGAGDFCGVFLFGRFGLVWFVFLWFQPETYSIQKCKNPQQVHTYKAVGCIRRQTFIPSFNRVNPALFLHLLTCAFRKYLYFLNANNINTDNICFNFFVLFYLILGMSSSSSDKKIFFTRTANMR